MEKLFSDYIKSAKLFEEQTPLLVAVSGGLDSVVLCYLLHKLAYSFQIAHCNFQLRNNESEQDHGFVQGLAEHLAVPFHVIRFQTKDFAQQQGLSVQEAARTLRYQWFEQTRRQHELSFVLTAHHATDNTETLLLNLVRGTGLSGLHGIPPQNGQIIRPLLPFSRAQLLAYAQEKGLQWREDSSNASDYYTRNKIRHHVWPVLASINPNLDQTIAQNIARFRAAENLQNVFIGQLKKKLLQSTLEGWRFAVAEAAALPEPAYVLYEILREWGFNATQVHNLLQAGQGQAGKQFFSPTHTLSLVDSYWLITPQITDWERVWIEENTAIVHSPMAVLHLRFLPEIPPEIPRLGVEEIWLDADKLRFPLLLRRWQIGDKLKPLGMAGRQKKVSDLLTDAKWSRPAKRQALVLCNNDDIVWVVGLRGSELYRVSAQTKRVLRIDIEYL
ncbi:tRNA lysidine(34) synthetase TilS [Flexibacter flexilis]|nr:tRNA lysidine(34) synthetase TilS [Flexibacter flexilis]